MNIYLLIIAYFLIGFLFSLIADRRSTYGIHFDHAIWGMLFWPLAILERSYNYLREVNKK